VIYRQVIDRYELLARLEDIKSRAKTSIEFSRRMVDETFLQFEATHRKLYAVTRAQEVLNALAKTAASRELSQVVERAKDKERQSTLHSGMTPMSMTCDHCEGILLNDKSYRVYHRNCR
jgi:hypothetical protein